MFGFRMLFNSACILGREVFPWHISRSCWRVQKVRISTHHLTLLPPPSHHFTLLPPPPHHFTLLPILLPHLYHHLPLPHNLPFPFVRGKPFSHDIDLLLTHHDPSTVAILLETLLNNLKKKVKLLCVCVCVCVCVCMCVCHVDACEVIRDVVCLYFM